MPAVDRLRQTFKTTVCMLCCEYAFLYDFKNVEIPFMHTKGDRCIKNAEMFRSYVETLPKYMNPWSKLSKPPGSKSLEYKEHGVKISVISSADSREKAMDMLRGITLFLALIDEFEFIQYIDAAMAGAAPAAQSARTIARETGTRTCLMLLSTPGDMDSSAGRAAQKMIDNTPRFTEKMYDLTPQELQEFFEGKTNTDESGQSLPVTMVYIEFNYKQLRKDDNWLRAQYAEAVRKNDLSEYRRGILLERFRGTGAELFKQDDIDYIKTHKRDPDHEILLINKYVLYVYNHDIVISDVYSDTPYFDITIPYLIGIDIAAGGNGDNTSFCVLHPYTLEVVAELYTPFMGSLDLLRVVTQLALLIPKGIFCPETNNVGKVLVDFVQESKLENRFYHDPKLDISKNAVTLDGKQIKSIQQVATEKGYIGTYVTSTVRDNMMDLLKEHVHDYRHLIFTKHLVEEIDKLVKDKRGKIVADTGEHDDMVMAYLHTLYVLYYGYDLMRFGIDKRLKSYKKVNEIMDQFNKYVNENVINNMIPAAGGSDEYENIILRDIAKTKADQDYGYDRNTGRDIYGYSRDQYNMNQQKQQRVSIADLSFFYDVNNNF